MARRTQAQRRASTIDALVEAAVGTIVERGYPRATMHEIATRAGLSQGAIFRHFATRTAFIGHVAMQVQAVAMDELERALTADRADMTTAVTAVRECLDSEASIVWHELETHARTDPELHAAFGPAQTARIERVHHIADTVPVLQELSDEQRRAVVELAVSVFRGEATVPRVLRTDRGDRMRREMLLGYLGNLVAEISDSTSVPHEESQSRSAHPAGKK